MTLKNKSFASALLLVLTACSVKQGHNHITEKPYMINGVRYKPITHYNYDQIGHASWYGDAFHGKPTASGIKYNKHNLVAAHRTLPLPSVVRVTNLDNGRSLVLTVTDRGPFRYTNKRIVDVSEHAAELLGFKNKGYTRVRVQCLKEHSVVAAMAHKRTPYCAITHRHVKSLSAMPKHKILNGFAYNNNSKIKFYTVNKSRAPQGYGFLSALDTVGNRIKNLFSSNKKTDTKNTNTKYTAMQRAKTRTIHNIRNNASNRIAY